MGPMVSALFEAVEVVPVSRWKEGVEDLNFKQVFEHFDIHTGARDMLDELKKKKLFIISLCIIIFF